MGTFGYSAAECALAAHFGHRMCRSGTFSSKGALRVLGREREREKRGFPRKKRPNAGRKRKRPIRRKEAGL